MEVFFENAGFFLEKLKFFLGNCGLSFLENGSFFENAGFSVKKCEFGFKDRSLFFENGRSFFQMQFFWTMGVCFLKMGDCFLKCKFFRQWDFVFSKWEFS